MKTRADEICAKPQIVDVPQTPSVMPIYPAAVYECDSTAQAGDLLSGEEDGFVYQRDGHPNAVVLAEQFRQLHGGDQLGVGFAHVTSTGMSALSLGVVSHLKQGDHILLSDQLYGRTTRLVFEELTRWGLSFNETNMCDIEQIKNAIRPNTRLMLLESIANPLLHIADLKSISRLCKEHEIKLMVDNTFATPMLLQPFAFGADLVMESVSKILNGHGDLMMGMICGKAESKERVTNALSSWGMTASPFDCWLASRGLATAHLRVERACQNAFALASYLESHAKIETVYYPGLTSHPSHENSQRFLQGRGGSVCSVVLKGGLEKVNEFISRSKKIRFCPSLGEIATTLSHPRSTSHRGLSEEASKNLGISQGLLRISCGVESSEFLVGEFDEILKALD